ncbi:crossover junction endonuclease MUS81 isoform X1 [Hyalella azteca]|uniref:Crossover junction endonuclease MUS81 n=1 Tax=Hyalella azteca TaxID=294128 RepID=A0A8B7P579_HYAAZ|nr:crossover junction endonuclease MUS81 isoform X2 [Hyalella azteca]XP_047735564.1 crossover junction endonuclease MUS81 isoform X1 [Hyalella azteca]
MDQQENQAKTRLAKRVKRQTVRYRHANPLFDEWLREWQDQARQADSNLQYIFAKARKSLQKFPLPVYCGADCKVLHYFGDKLCNMIDKKIASYELEHGTIDWDKHITAQRGKVKVCIATESPRVPSASAPRPKKTKRSARQAASVPTNSAGSESVALKRQNRPRKPVTEKVRKSKKSLTSPSIEPVPMLPVDGISPEACDSEHDDQLSTDTIQFTLLPGSYDIVLCVDCAETTSKSSKAGIVKELTQHGVLYDVRKLHVGDFAWVARENTPEGKTVREVMLPCIVERKRMDDLASSIKDGRCREQKHRLLQCGIDTAIYLVETAGQHRAGLPLSTCHQAVANTNVVDGLLVKWTADYKESAGYLTLLTRILQSTYQGLSVRALKGGKLPTPCPVGCCDLLEFSTFNKGLVKNRQLVVREMLAKHLLQVAGLSVQKVTAIVNEAPTLQALLSLLSSEEGIEKLGALKATRSGRPLGAAVAATLRSLYFDTCLR